MSDHDPFTLDIFGSSALSSGLGLGVTAFAEHDHTIGVEDPSVHFDASLDDGAVQGLVVGSHVDGDLDPHVTLEPLGQQLRTSRRGDVPQRRREHEDQHGAESSSEP